MPLECDGLSGESLTQLSGEGLTQLSGEGLTQLSGESLTQLSGESLTQLSGESLTQLSGKGLTQFVDTFEVSLLIFKCRDQSSGRIFVTGCKGDSGSHIPAAKLARRR